MNTIWKNDIKEGGKKINEEKYVEVMAELDERITKLNKQGCIRNFFKKKNINNNGVNSERVVVEEIVIVNEEVLNNEEEDNTGKASHDDHEDLEEKAPPPTPAQDRLSAMLIGK